jgi:prophage antirepressor-like protein
MAAIQAFDFGDRKVRVAGTADAPLFCAADVCEALTLGDVSCACERLDQDEVELVAVPAKNSHERVGAGNGFRTYKTLYVTESGLFSLILGCTKPEAKSFKKWVTSEVLPEIRKRGYYDALEVAQRKQTELLLAECFPNLPQKSEPIFRELISSLLKLRRETDAPGNPPWARGLASAVYAWAIRVEGQQEYRRSKNPHPRGNSTDHSMFGKLAEDAVRRVVNSGCDFARISNSWQDWRLKMELVFGTKALQFPLMVPMLHARPAPEIELNEKEDEEVES